MFSLHSIVLLCFYLPLITSYHGSLCIGNVENPNAAHSIGSGNLAYQTTFRHLTLKASLENDAFDNSETENNQWNPYYIQYKSPDLPSSEMENNTLFGWISIEIKIKNGLQTALIQPFVPEEYFAYVPGEVVATRLAGDCKEKIGDDDFNKAYLSPCYYVPNPSSTVPVAMTYASTKEVTSIRFTFRADFPECAAISEKQSLEFRFYANRPRGNGGNPLFTAPQKKLYVKNITYGGYDPEPPRNSPGVVNCGTPLNPDPTLRWVHLGEDALVGNPSMPNQPVNQRIHVCYDYATHRQTSLSGRCGKTWSERSSSVLLGNDIEMRCDGDRSFRKDLNGSVYIAFNPEFPPGGGHCEGCMAARTITRQKGISCDSDIGKIIWALRSTHGMAMVWTVMFVMTLSTTISRYYKETFTNYRFVNVHVWHGVHIYSSMVAFSGLLSGWTAAFVGRYYFGFSRYSCTYWHCCLGYLSFAAFLFTISSSPFRKYAKEQRLLTIFTHFLAGTVARVCWVLCILTSFCIPGSPSSKTDSHLESNFEPLAVIVIVWIVVTIIINVVLTLNLNAYEKVSKFKRRRTYAFVVPIPLVRPYVVKDIPGAGLKKILLLVQSGCGILLTFIFSIRICFSSTEDRFFGHMMYTHKESGKLNWLMRETFYD